jgi:hypothetical protein
MIKVIIFQDEKGSISHVTTSGDVQYVIVKDSIGKESTDIAELSGPYEPDSFLPEENFEDLFDKELDKELIKSIKWIL